MIVIGEGNGRNKQKGITMWGIMSMIFIGVFFLFLFFKIFPPYLEDAQISSALDRFASSPGARHNAPSQVKDSIERRFDIDNIRNATRKDIRVVPEGSTYAVELDYFVEVPMFGNLNVVIDFNHRVTPR